MTKQPDAASLGAEFDALLARAGLTIPEDRRAGLLIAFADLRAEILRLHEALPPELEPAAVYRPTSPDEAA